MKSQLAIEKGSATLRLTLEVVDENADRLETEEVRQVLLHLAEEPVMVPLRAYLARQPQRVNNGFLARLNLPQSKAPLEAELEVVAKDLEDLLVGDLKALVLVGLLAEARLALHGHDDLVVSVDNRLHKVLVP